jgi:hypothetical protein
MEPQRRPWPGPVADLRRAGGRGVGPLRRAHQPRRWGRARTNVQRGSPIEGRPESPQRKQTLKFGNAFVRFALSAIATDFVVGIRSRIISPGGVLGLFHRFRSGRDGLLLR